MVRQEGPSRRCRQRPRSNPRSARRLSLHPVRACRDRRQPRVRDRAYPPGRLLRFLGRLFHRWSQEPSFQPTKDNPRYINPNDAAIDRYVTLSHSYPVRFRRQGGIVKTVKCHATFLECGVSSDSGFCGNRSITALLPSPSSYNTSTTSYIDRY
jgi:hypothetical protein